MIKFVGIWRVKRQPAVTRDLGKPSSGSKGEMCWMGRNRGEGGQVEQQWAQKGHPEKGGSDLPLIPCFPQKGTHGK